MLSLIKRKNIIKNKFKNLKKITLCKIFSDVDTSDEGVRNNISNINIESNGVFKMLEINYVGDVFNIVNNTSGMKIKLGKNKIIIYNYLKRNIQDGVLFTFRGAIAKFNKVVVFGWGQPHFIAETQLPFDIQSNINRDANIVSASSYKFYGQEGN